MHPLRMTIRFIKDHKSIKTFDSKVLKIIAIFCILKFESVIDSESRYQSWYLSVVKREIDRLVQLDYC